MREIGTRLATCLIAATVAFGFTATRCQAAEPETSKLWGRHGELWSASSRLPDFSYAGYHRGEQALPPNRKAEVSVKDFGAKGDGRTDDTASFQRAIEESPGKVIGIPAGRYVLNDFVTISHSGTVLQGAGADHSILVMPTPLDRVKPNQGATTSGRPTSNYSWSGGFIVVRGRTSNRMLSRVVAPARRGASELSVEDVKPFAVGDDVRLVMRDTRDNAMARYFYNGDSGPVEKLNGRLSETFLARVAAVDVDRRQVRLDRPLRTDVRLDWSPGLYPASSSVEEVGVEGLGFEFPVTPYEGHFTEKGFNAIDLGDVRNCWVRDVRIRHSDSGIFIDGNNITLTGIVLESARTPDQRLQCTGHHGIVMGGTDCLLTDFDFRTRFIHDVTVTRGSTGNVVMQGKGVDLALDHHRYANHANLWTELDAGAGTRLFHSGGGDAIGWHCGAWETFWNIRADRPQGWPSGGSREKWSCDLINLVGLTTNQPSVTDPDGRWFEAIPPKTLVPANLHDDQMQRRMNKAGATSAAR